MEQVRRRYCPSIVPNGYKNKDNIKSRKFSKLGFCFYILRYFTVFKYEIRYITINYYNNIEPKTP